MDISQSHAALNRDVFLRGVSLGVDGNAELMHSLFAARTAGLMGQLNAVELPDFLSGILIGAEITSANKKQVKQVHVLGEGDLCARYAYAFQHQGISVIKVGDDATT
jgi:2-dehydro-3-deoxygalactonokinase